MRLWTFFLAISLTLSSLGLGSDRPEARTADSIGPPLWRFDLHSVGYTGFAPKKETWGLHFNPKPLCFSEDSVLIATFIAREGVTTLTRRDEPSEMLPLKLHGVFLDSSAGSVRATKTWPLTLPRGGIVAGGEGRFLVLTPAMIVLYSPELVPLRDLELSPDRQAHLWDFLPSPTGKSILVWYNECTPRCDPNPAIGDEPQKPDTSFQWVDTGSLQPEATWTEGLLPLSVSDGEVVYVKEDYVRSHGTTHRVLIRTADGHSQTVCRVRLGFEPDNGCDYPQFLSNNLLAFWAPHRLGLAPTTRGETQRLAGFRQDDWLGLPLPSSDGSRFAVAISAHKGGSALLDISPHSVLKRIMVFDVPSRQWVYTLDAKKQKIRTISGLALSPDGSLMAIMYGAIVELYRLPEPPPSPPRL